MLEKHSKHLIFLESLSFQDIKWDDVGTVTQGLCED